MSNPPIATPTYVIFPNTIFVAQPGFVSRATAYPTALELSRRIEELS